MKTKDCYEYGIFDEMEQNGILEMYFGVAKCYIILENTSKSQIDYEESNENLDLKRILIDKEVLTEAQIIFKNGINIFLTNFSRL